jgi:hypothetical protein
MRVKQDFFSKGHFKVDNGSTVRFWEDIWLGDMSLAQQYPSLYNIVQHKNILVSTVLAQTPLNICFQRDSHLCQRLINVNLSSEPAKFV